MKALDVVCDRCGAQPGQQCEGIRTHHIVGVGYTRDRKTPHPERVSAAREAAG